jgi:hypothetical protein
VPANIESGGGGAVTKGERSRIEQAIALLMGEECHIHEAVALLGSLVGIFVPAAAIADLRPISTLELLEMLKKAAGGKVQL